MTGRSSAQLTPYQHDLLVEAFKNRKNIVVTRGTGSGKTECFLLPLFADLIKESVSWPKFGRPRTMCVLIGSLMHLQIGIR